MILSFRLQHHIFATNFYSYLIYGLGHHVYGSLFGVRLTKIASMALLPGSISICAIALSSAHSKPSSRRSRLFCSPASCASPGLLPKWRRNRSYHCLLLRPGPGGRALLKQHHQWLESRWAQIVIRSGKHSLSVFCVSVGPRHAGKPASRHYEWGYLDAISGNDRGRGNAFASGAIPGALGFPRVGLTAHLRFHPKHIRPRTKPDRR